MVNNSFHLIGIATSNFQEVSSGHFKSYLLRVEVEKMGSKSGKNFELEIQVYGTNRAVDVSAYILGHQIAVSGYLDAFTNKDGGLTLKVVAQNIYVCDKGTRQTFGNEQSAPSLAPEAEGSGNFEAFLDELENEQPQQQPLADDDLPF